MQAVSTQSPLESGTESPPAADNARRVGSISKDADESTHPRQKLSPQLAPTGIEAHETAASKSNAHVIVWLMSRALLLVAMSSSPPDQELAPMDKSER